MTIEMCRARTVIESLVRYKSRIKVSNVHNSYYIQRYCHSTERSTGDFVFTSQRPPDTIS